MRVRKNDQVVVIAGNYKGKKGKVLKVYPEKKQIIVEGVHFIKRHSRPSQQNPKGGIVEKEAPIHVSNVMVLCPKTGVPTRLGFKVIYDDTKKRNNRIRVCKKSGEMIV
ncbi:MAG TPA: 50S ribosomal protein L24 [bacterium]|nr:50S ribosomal protein L24 [bacterium]HPN41922.1 50S ribosomal protein L24 [bacterium]